MCTGNVTARSRSRPYSRNRPDCRRWSGTEGGLEGKTALVTGSSRGIGRAVALTLARRGLDVVVNYRSREDAAAEVAREVESTGRRCLAVKADVGDPEQARGLARAAVEEFGGIEVLVNNAGIWRPSVIESVRPDTLEMLIATNVKGAFFITGPVVESMKRTGWGRIVNISSVIGVSGYPGDSVYSATKSALFGLTKSLAKELARFNVNVNAVVPGFIETDMHFEIGDDARAKILKTIPLRRWGRPEDVAELVSFLVEKGDYITGQLFTVDGGYTI